MQPASLSFSRELSRSASGSFAFFKGAGSMLGMGADRKSAMSFRGSVNTKVLVAGGGTIGALLLLGSFLVTHQVGNTVSDLSERYGTQLSQASANAIAADLARVESTGKSMTSALAALHEKGVRDRQPALDVLRPNVESSPYVMGSWYFEAPNAWDGQDAAMVGKKALGSNGTGTFMPYWARLDGQVSMEPAEDNQVYPEPLFYTAPANTGATAMIDPYPYNVGSRTVLMTSVAFPVMSGGKLIGTAVNSTWAVVMDVPASTIGAPARDLANGMMVGGPP